MILMHQTSRRSYVPWIILVACIVGVFLTDPLLATGLQWDAPLTLIRTSLTGPVAFAIVFIAMIVAGATLIFARNDLSEFAQRIIYIVLVFCVIALPTQLLTTLFSPATTTPSGLILPM